MKSLQLLTAALLLAAAAAAGSDQPAAAAAGEKSDAAEDTATDGANRKGRFFSYVSSLFGYPKPVQPVVAVPHLQGVHRPIHIKPIIVIKPASHHSPAPCTGWGCQQCSTLHYCQTGYCWSGHCVQCLSDEHCGSSAHYSCKEHKCVPKPPVYDLCSTANPCPYGYYCFHRQCKPYVPPGYPCNGPNSCESRSCPHNICAQCSDWKQCPYGKYCDKGVCNKPGGTGDSCWVEQECQSHLCLHGKCAVCSTSQHCALSQYCELGRCKDKLELNQGRCHNNIQCKSGKCNTVKEKCIQCTSTSECGPHKFCNKNQRCVNKKQLADDCKTNEQCISGKCNKKCVLCRNSGDCDQSRQYCDVKDGGSCKHLVKIGKLCGYNYQCERPYRCMENKCAECNSDNHCKNEKWRCVGFKCELKKALREKCDDHKECLSDICIRKKCVQCTKNGPDTCGRNKKCNNQGFCVAKKG